MFLITKEMRLKNWREYDPDADRICIPCAACGNDVEKVVALGEYDKLIWVCKDCLSRALELIDGNPDR